MPTSFVAQAFSPPAAKLPRRREVSMTHRSVAPRHLRDAFSQLDIKVLSSAEDAQPSLLAALPIVTPHENLLRELAGDLGREVKNYPGAHDGQLFHLRLQNIDGGDSAAWPTVGGGITRLVGLPLDGSASTRANLLPEQVRAFCGDWTARIRQDLLLFTAYPSLLEEAQLLDQQENDRPLNAEQVSRLRVIHGKMLAEAMAASMQSLSAQVGLISTLGNLHRMGAGLEAYRTIAKNSDASVSEQEAALIIASQAVRHDTRQLVASLQRDALNEALSPQLRETLRTGLQQLRSTGVTAEAYLPQIIAVPRGDVLLTPSSTATVVSSAPVSANNAAPILSSYTPVAYGGETSLSAATPAVVSGVNVSPAVILQLANFSPSTLIDTSLPVMSTQAPVWSDALPSTANIPQTVSAVLGAAPPMSIAGVHTVSSQTEVPIASAPIVTAQAYAAASPQAQANLDVPRAAEAAAATSFILGAIDLPSIAPVIAVLSAPLAAVTVPLNEPTLAVSPATITKLASAPAPEIPTPPSTAPTAPGNPGEAPTPRPAELPVAPSAPDIRPSAPVEVPAPPAAPTTPSQPVPPSPGPVDPIPANPTDPIAPVPIDLRPTHDPIPPAKENKSFRRLDNFDHQEDERREIRFGPGADHFEAPRESQPAWKAWLEVRREAVITLPPKTSGSFLDVSGDKPQVIGGGSAPIKNQFKHAASGACANCSGGSCATCPHGGGAFSASEADALRAKVNAKFGL